MTDRRTPEPVDDAHRVTNPAVPDPTPPKPSRTGGNIVIAVIVVVTALIILGGIGALGDPDPDDAVKDACQSSIESRLKAPASADFGGQIAIDDGNGNWTVEGSVDAQNSFGATIRTDYTCTVEYDDGDAWVTDVTTT